MVSVGSLELRFQGADLDIVDFSHLKHSEDGMGFG